MSDSGAGACGRCEKEREQHYRRSIVEKTLSLDERGEPRRHFELFEHRDDSDGIGRGH